VNGPIQVRQDFQGRLWLKMGSFANDDGINNGE
jgi:hypothetical protein